MSTPRFSPVKDQQIVVVCDFASIATGDISEVLSALKSLSGDRSPRTDHAASTLTCPVVP